MNQCRQNAWKKVCVWKWLKREGVHSTGTGATPHALRSQACNAYTTCSTSITQQVHSLQHQNHKGHTRKTANSETLDTTDTRPPPSGREEGKQQNRRAHHWENPLHRKTGVTHRHLGHVCRAVSQRERLTPASEGSDAAPGLTAS